VTRARAAKLPAVAALLLLALGAAPAAAHRLAPSLLELRELASGEVAVRWKTPLLQPTGADLRPELPPHCAPLGPAVAERDPTSATLRWRVDCGERGLVGETLRVRGLEGSGTDALIRLELSGGRRVRAVVTANRPGFAVPEREQPLRVLADYLALGFQHILGGADHLLFVLGLVLLIRGRRRLVGTITAFTLGHSLTLSLAALGFVAFPTRLVEVGIALSILLLAAELGRGQEPGMTRLRRHPWAMALCFGLLHGVGFAGALTEAGLPAEEIPLALFSFNLGIELGQLAFVAAVVVARLALRPLAARGPVWLARVPAYAIGSLAALWCFERTAGML
jgi:hydrogenase/urease accessory protein HupE